MSTEAPDGLDCLPGMRQVRIFRVDQSPTISGGDDCDNGMGGKAKGRYCYAEAIEKPPVSHC